MPVAMAEKRTLDLDLKTLVVARRRGRHTPVVAKGWAIRSVPNVRLGNGLPDAAGEFSKSIAVLHL